MYLSDNILSSDIPSSLGDCKNILDLNLSRNILTGPIAKQVLSISSLRTIDLSQNHFNSTLPIVIGDLKNLEYFNVSSNNFAGGIPSTFGSCVRLEFLDMGRNSFQGNIPSTLGSLRGLQILDLSRNNFDGSIPSYLAEFNLLILNLSFNNFDGTLPEDGVFKNASIVSVTGNPKLCGGEPGLKLPKCSNLKQSKKASLSLTLKIVISTLSVVLGLSMILGLGMFLCLKQAKKDACQNPFSNPMLNVSYQTLLQATGGFSNDMLLGAGGYGSVYKGNLGEERTTLTVAIKVLTLSRNGALKSFISECEALRNIRHRNLVKVLTACSSVDFQGNDFKALVYEFMPNGSLQEWLHPKSNEGGQTRNLNLAQRLSVAIDIACAVDYLHFRLGSPIVHCDLKPSNVLLDDELVGHVGDFGIARFLSKASDSFSKHQMSSSLIKGTIGYTAPEYGMGSKPSTYGDVYSFGILLLELFTGKRPTDEIFRDAFGLCNFVQKSLPGRVIDIVDPMLLHHIEMETEGNHSGPNYSSTEYHKFENCLIKIFEVGVACSAESAKERMNIADAVNELQSIRYSFLT